MNITVNGETREARDRILLSAFIQELGISCDRVVVERNRTIVSAEAYGETKLEEGDQLEIVSFVGGG